MSRFAAQGRTPEQVVQATLGCDAETAQGVVRRLASVMEDATARAFLLRYGEVTGIGGLDALTGDRALLHVGRREVALFMLRCLGPRMIEPEVLASMGGGDVPDGD